MVNVDWSSCPVVESVPGKMSGAWVLKGTRMPVVSILENIECGASLDDILEWFDGLHREQVKTAIAFAERSQGQPTAHSPAQMRILVDQASPDSLASALNRPH
ncbi:MAG: DUF433 domain-containing protein [Acidobacteria bacterium]|nr:DUF433 domain-containing protein [Acidobacteriota bacterium]